MQILGLRIVSIYIISRLIFKLFVETGTFSEGKRNELQIKEDNGIRWHKCPFVLFTISNSGSLKSIFFFILTIVPSNVLINTKKKVY